MQEAGSFAFDNSAAVERNDLIHALKSGVWHVKTSRLWPAVRFKTLAQFLR